MLTRNLLRIGGVVLAMVFAASPSAGYIHFPPTTMPKMCKPSTNIRVLEVKKHDKEKGVIVYEVVETLKGQNPKGMSFKHAIGKQTAGTKPIFDWVADKKQAVMFTIEAGNICLRVRLHRQVLLLGGLQPEGGLLAPDSRRSRDGVVLPRVGGNTAEGDERPARRQGGQGAGR